MDYAYNIDAIIELYDQGHSIDVLDISVSFNILRRASDAGIVITNSALQAIVPDDAKMQLDQITTGSSFVISVKGMAHVIQSLASIFDPLQRKKQHEDLAHKTEMNQIEEERARFNLAKERYEYASVVMNHLSNFNNRLPGDVGEGEVGEFKQLAVTTYAQAIRSLQSNEIIIIERPEITP